MSNLPGVSDILDLLDALKDAAQEFHAREAKLESDFRLATAAETKAREAQTRAEADDLSRRIAEATARLQADAEACRARLEQRKQRINEAHYRTHKRILESVSEQEGRQKNRIQTSALEAERRRDAERAHAETAREEFHRQVDETLQSAALLERTARRVFRGYGAFRRLLAREERRPAPEVSGAEQQALAEVRNLHARAGEALRRFGKNPLSWFFRFFPVWLLALLLIGFAAAVYALRQAGVDAIPPRDVEYAVVAFVALLAIHVLGRTRAVPAAKTIAGDLVKARRLLEACPAKADAHFQEEQERIVREFADTTSALDLEWRKTIKTAIDLRGVKPAELEEKARRLYQKNEQYHRAKLQRLEHDRATVAARLQQEAGVEAKKLADAHAAKMARLDADHEAQWQALQAEWRSRVEPIYAAIRAANAGAEKFFPPWEIERWKNWTPPDEFRNAAQFGRLEVELEKYLEVRPRDDRLALPGPATLSVPLALAYPQQGSILFEAAKTGSDEAIRTINNVIFRLLSTTPPGKLSFTIFDPVGLGQNFAGLMHLADYEESHINSRIWTQSTQFEEKLAELNEHMEKVIQMYLRNEYATIAEYNAQAGAIAEKYHFLVIASFPVNFTDVAAKRLRNIATSGARCGVYTLIHWDQRNALPADFVPDELRKNSVRLVRAEKGLVLADWQKPGTQLTLDPPPTPEFATQFLHQVGQSSKDSNRVEVPFSQVAPPDAKLWSEETTEELRVPIGRSGATKFQYLAIGRDTRQHALVAGKTGSGKSTLFHVVITNLALWCSPEQVEFYLVDFKKGVEFKCYANRHLPHARVVAIESDREFGLSVLQRVDAELRRRGDMFRKLGVQDLPGYKAAGGTEPLPRSLLIIDEFQEFFVEEDRISQGAAVLLDRIVRQGRAFGIHVVLGSQTLGGAYTLARATLGQMVIRIALQCNEADAYLIMDQDNPAPRLLSRPGEGIYNDAAGSLEGNSPFQAVWLPEEVRDRYLAKVRARADQSDDKYPGPFVFEGNAPADVRENAWLNALLKAEPAAPPVPSRIWLGAPNSIKGPTEAAFLRRSGSNLLIVGQSEEASLTMLSVSLVALAAQYPAGTARFILFDSTLPESPERQFLDNIIKAIPHEIVRVKGGDVTATMGQLAGQLKRRGEGEPAGEAPETFVLVHGLQNYKKLRQEDEFSFSSGSAGEGVQPATVFLDLITEGPGRGFHVIATCDTYNNVNRFLGRKNLSEFEMRVLFQMSASDSASLIDAPDAATLGLHRALYYNDREGYLETFRPYARPGNDWIDTVSQVLKGVRA